MTDAKHLQNQIDVLKKDITFELQKRERPDRHPYQIGSLVGLLIVSFAQATLGISPSSALWGVTDRSTLLAIDSAFIVGSTLCLYGAWLSRDKHFELSVHVGMWGHFSIFFACLSYTAIIIASQEPRFSEKPYWLGVTSVGLTLGIAYASVMRYRQMRGLMKEWHLRNRS